MQLKSDAFSPEGRIPEPYTCDGENVSPPLRWTNVPGAAKSLALMLQDPDAPSGVFVHWIVYNIPPNELALPKSMSRDPMIGNGVRQGENSFQHIGYDGPCLPSGTHRYQFQLYALDTVLGLEPGATKEQLLAAIDGHVLDSTMLEAKFGH